MLWFAGPLAVRGGSRHPAQALPTAPLVVSRTDVTLPVFGVLAFMGTEHKRTPEAMRERLATVVARYRELLRADERRLQEAMRLYERSFRGDRLHRAA